MNDNTKPIKVIVISPTDVSPYVESQEQKLSPQTEANTQRAIEEYNQFKDTHEVHIFVMGGNGDTATKEGYLGQKLKALRDPNYLGPEIIGKTEAELTQEYLIANGVNPEVVTKESDPGSKSTIENAKKLVEFLKTINPNSDKEIDVKVFAWEMNELKVSNLLSDSNLQIPEVLNPLKEGLNYKFQIPEVLKKPLSHAERVGYTYNKVLENEGIQVKAEVIPVGGYLGDKTENSQDTLTDEGNWAAIQVLAWLKTYLDLNKEKPNDSNRENRLR